MSAPVNNGAPSASGAKRVASPVKEEEETTSVIPRDIPEGWELFQGGSVKLMSDNNSAARNGLVAALEELGIQVEVIPLMCAKHIEDAAFGNKENNARRIVGFDGMLYKRDGSVSNHHYSSVEAAQQMKNQFEDWKQLSINKTIAAALYELMLECWRDEFKQPKEYIDDYFRKQWNMDTFYFDRGSCNVGDPGGMACDNNALEAHNKSWKDQLLNNRYGVTTMLQKFAEHVRKNSMIETEFSSTMPVTHKRSVATILFKKETADRTKRGEEMWNEKFFKGVDEFLHGPHFRLAQIFNTTYNDTNKWGWNNSAPSQVACMIVPSTTVLGYIEADDSIPSAEDVIGMKARNSWVEFYLRIYHLHIGEQPNVFPQFDGRRLTFADVISWLRSFHVLTPITDKDFLVACQCNFSFSSIGNCFLNSAINCVANSGSFEPPDKSSTYMEIMQKRSPDLRVNKHGSTCDCSKDLFSGPNFKLKRCFTKSSFQSRGACFKP